MTKKGEAAAYYPDTVMKHDTDGCLFWPFSRTRDGTARLTRDGKSQPVGRLVCFDLHGEPPTLLHQAAHSCGNGHLGCVSLRHLSWKSPAENAADKLLHGTHLQGEAISSAKLTEAQVIEARALRGIVSQQVIADRFGVKQAAISKVQLGQTWRHVSAD